MSSDDSEFERARQLSLQDNQQYLDDDKEMQRAIQESLQEQVRMQQLADQQANQLIVQQQSQVRGRQAKQEEELRRAIQQSEEEYIRRESLLLQSEVQKAMKQSKEEFEKQQQIQQQQQIQAAVKASERDFQKLAQQQFVNDLAAAQQISAQLYQNFQESQFNKDVQKAAQISRETFDKYQDLVLEMETNQALQQTRTQSDYVMELQSYDQFPGNFIVVQLLDKKSKVILREVLCQRPKRIKHLLNKPIALKSFQPDQLLVIERFTQNLDQSTKTSTVANHQINFSIDQFNTCSHIPTNSLLLCKKCNTYVGCPDCHECQNFEFGNKIKCLNCQFINPFKPEKPINSCLRCHTSLYDHYCLTCGIVSIEFPFFHCKQSNRCVMGYKSGKKFCNQCGFNGVVNKHICAPQLKDESCAYCTSQYDDFIHRPVLASCKKHYCCWSCANIDGVNGGIVCIICGQKGPISII